MIKIELTDQEAQSLVELLDLATKAGGIGAARYAVPLVQKVMDATNAAKQNQPQPAQEQ